VPYDEACRRRFATDWTRSTIDRPAFLGCRVLEHFPLAHLVDYIDWSPFFMAWELKGKYPAILSDDPKGRPGGPRTVRQRAQRCWTRSSPIIG
jgi:5-methyltetrahydrofolate--homocysteine methyltransferase